MAPPALNDNDGTDLKAWLCTVPGIPADWPVCESHIFSLPQSVAPVPQHIGEVPIGDDLPANFGGGEGAYCLPPH